ncbi:ethylene-responsive transcription factor ERF017-like [Vicia villosa]|uniref:ethylene-responsive transcription factor ERF017-like n=1 Tax=Vicia villosa TaxID=3911 RepID=UPI00273B0BCF|nr:ethylene-responsive transcription factor ERF017-like [Vicia villosa]
MVKTNVEKPAAERSDSLFRGVRKRKWGKYVSEIRLPNSRQRIWLGSYDSAEKAARAFDAATYCLRGSGAKFNFPNNPPHIAGGSSMTHSEIQAAAARFANSEPYNEYLGQPDNTPDETPSSSVGTPTTPLLPMELPSPALSDATVQTESDLTDNELFRDITNNELFRDLFSDTGSGYTMFPGFDDFCGDFYVPEFTNFDYEQENMDELIIHDSFLWSF